MTLSFADLRNPKAKPRCRNNKDERPPAHFCQNCVHPCRVRAAKSQVGAAGSKA